MNEHILDRQRKHQSPQYLATTLNNTNRKDTARGAQDSGQSFLCVLGTDEDSATPELSVQVHLSPPRTYQLGLPHSHVDGTVDMKEDSGKWTPPASDRSVAETIYYNVKKALLDGCPQLETVVISAGGR